jgi:hypothetical protein
MQSILAGLPDDERISLTRFYSDSEPPERAIIGTGLSLREFSALRANVRSQYLRLTGRLCQ